MPKFVIDQMDYALAQSYGSQVLAGSAFAFVAPQAQPDDALQAGLQSFYGLPATATRRVLPLLPDGLSFPGFKITSYKRPFDLVPVLLPDKEIYRAGQDHVRLLLVTPAWLYTRPDRSRPTEVALTIENNGVVLRNQTVQLDAGGLTLLDLGALPEGHYRVFWPDTNENAETKPAECEFSSVEYVLAPLQATLQNYELAGDRLNCRLRIERFSEPLNEPVQLELWSGGNRLAGSRVKPDLPGIYQARFRVKTKSQERLEIRASYQDLVATAVIPNSTKAARQEVLFSPLGQEVRLSLQPGPTAREVRGLYLGSDGPVSNSSVTLADPASHSRVAKLRWNVEAEAARLLVLDLAGKVVEDRDLGQVTAHTEFEVKVPVPGGFLALGAWLGDTAWEGWSSLVAPSTGQVELKAPATARPGSTIEVKIDTRTPASVYLLARDSRLAGANPQERLAATLKGGFESAAKWATLGPISKNLTELDDWPDVTIRYRTMAFGAVPAPMRMAMAADMPRGAMAGGPVMNAASSAPGQTRPGAVYKGGVKAEMFMDFDAATTGPATAPATVREDFADVAFCAVIKTGADGRATASIKLPQAITGYTLEAFALGEDGREWAYTSESLEANQPLWAEFKLPAFVAPGDVAPAALEINCNGGKFVLKLLCDDRPVPFTLAGAKQLNADSFEGKRAKATFEARPGRWRAELQDLTSGELDASERTVEALGKFTGLARRFQMLLTGQSLDLATTGAVQLRVLPSLDTPFKVLCDATTDYGHRCCQQTAAKLLAGVAALVAANNEDRAKYRDVILAGVKREKSMYLPGKGFMMYPPEESGGNREPNLSWGKLAAQNLGFLSYLGGSAFDSFDAELRNALKVARVMAEDAMQAYGLPLVPEKIENARDAYQVFLAKGPKQSEALAYARSSLANQTGGAGKGRVLAREETAYAAANLLAGGVQADLLTAIRAANDLAKELDGEGRLYSTVDSAALICLLLGLKLAGIGANGDATRLKLDGQEMPLSEALKASASGEIRAVEVVQGTALVEVTSEIVEDWNSFRHEIPVSVELARRSRRFGVTRVGDTLDLVVTLREYVPGHLLHVCLPSSLSSLEGGGEVKKFSLDFTGRTVLRVPLRATGHTLGQGEHWAVLVRNMFNEEQAGSPGVLVAQVSAD